MNYIQEVIEVIIIFGLIGVVVRFVIFRQLEITDKNTVSFDKNSNAVVSFPSILMWLGLPITIFSVIGPFGHILFPKIFDKEPIVENLLLSSPMVLLGLFSSMSGLFWNIQIDKDSDYFIYRTTFGRTYKIYYNEISYFKTWKHLLLFKYKRKFFFVSPDAINYHFFLQMLIRKDVKKIFRRV
ncbi:hypothetical protein ACFVSW_23880 [Neobacillus sp. NPDC058068]|uniref:hypothetical protein n=1 Tax=Neobacillus sp. NPDC058068 TaxID=3346325 RepID=UPI0036DAE652